MDLKALTFCWKRHQLPVGSGMTVPFIGELGAARTGILNKSYLSGVAIA